MTKTITLTIVVTDKEFEVLKRAAHGYDYEVDQMIAQPIHDMLYDCLGDDETQVSVKTEEK